MKIDKWSLLCGVVLFIAISLVAINKYQPQWAEAEKGVVSGESYDLIVVGSDPEGVAAAVSGARNGLSTLLVDTRPEVGGLMVRGWLNSIDMNYAPNRYGPNYQVLNQGIFAEFYHQIEGDSFDINTARNVFNQMLDNEENVQVQLGVRSMKAVLVGNTVTGVKVVDAQGNETTYNCQRMIDATQDADIAAAAGVPFTIGQEDMGYPERNMAATLVFRLDGVSDADWLKIRTLLNTDTDKNTGANAVSAWGFGEIMDLYRSSNSNVGIRGLNMGRQKDGSILINALQVYNFNWLDNAEKEKARAAALKELPLIMAYINQNVPALENAKLEGTAPELYVRETRHIQGEYCLTVDDLLESHDFPDRIAFGSYPVDVQAMDQENKGFIIGKPYQYAIPFRSLVPNKVENLLVVGRSASFTSLAAGSARVIPVGMATGEAAGAATAVSLDDHLTFRQMSAKSMEISKLQAKLNAQGMVIKPIAYVPEIKVMAEWCYPGVKYVRSYALTRGWYDNNYYLDQVIWAGDFMDILNTLCTLKKYPVSQEAKINLAATDELYIQDVTDILNQYTGQKLKVKESYDYYCQKGVIDAATAKNIEENNGGVTRGAAYMIIKNFFTVMAKK